jgi:hypothetical protein
MRRKLRYSKAGLEDLEQIPETFWKKGNNAPLLFHLPVVGGFNGAK